MKKNLRNTYRPPTPLLSQEEKDEAFKRASNIIAESNLTDYRFSLSLKQQNYQKHKFHYTNINIWEAIETNKPIDEIVEKSHYKELSKYKKDKYGK